MLERLCKVLRESNLFETETKLHKEGAAILVEVYLPLSF